MNHRLAVEITKGQVAEVMKVTSAGHDLIQSPLLRQKEPGSFNLALMFADGAALDKFFDQLEAAGKQNPGIGEILDSLTVAKDHRDILDRVTAYQHK